MIIDDCSLIIGSANINDRSMLGSRDSETAVYIEGPRNKTVFTGFDNMAVNQKIHDFRKLLFQEHYGIEVEYPTSNETWNRLYRITATNTMVYNKVFKTYPSNEYSSFKSLATRHKSDKLDPNLFAEEIQKVSGHAVLFPYLFLSDEDLIGGTNGEIQLYVVPLYALQ